VEPLVRSNRGHYDRDNDDRHSAPSGTEKVGSGGILVVDRVVDVA
jgi:hypothetical protein